MAEVILRGKVKDGRLVLESDQVDLPDTPVEITVKTQGYGVALEQPQQSNAYDVGSDTRILSSSLEEIKAWMKNPPELTPERKKILDELYDHHEKIARDTGLPDDFIDNLDKYLYSFNDEEE